MKLIALTVLLASLAGCTDATYERTFSYNNPHSISFYSGGVKVAEWTSTGAPRSVSSEDGWMFVDKATGHLVTVTGDVVIEMLPEGSQ